MEYIVITVKANTSKEMRLPTLQGAHLVAIGGVRNGAQHAFVLDANTGEVLTHYCQPASRRLRGSFRNVIAMRPSRKAKTICDAFTSWIDDEGEYRQGFAHDCGIEIWCCGSWMPQYQFEGCEKAYPEIEVRGLF